MGALAFVQAEKKSTVALRRLRGRCFGLPGCVRENLLQFDGSKVSS